ncbi:LOW QUALITY PROTEIN: hypothetical protein CFOL_v3_18618, partial [Cephalotus follicularis]
FKLQTIAQIDSGAQMNCIQEGLIPTKFFEKTKQRLSTVNGENLSVRFEIPVIHICNDDICIKQTFILVKDLDIKIILGQPFLEIIKPFKVKNEGITTKIFQRKILFAFNARPITKEVNILKTLSMFEEHLINLIIKKHLYFMKSEISKKKLEEQLKTSQMQEKIISLKNNITNNLCSDPPDAFWHRKRHVVSLPYEKYFSERNIPTKARPIQMTHELMEHKTLRTPVETLAGAGVGSGGLRTSWGFDRCLCRCHIGTNAGDSSGGTITPIQRSILFAEKFPYIILDKKQLQRFLGSLNYMRDFFQNLQDLCTPLYQRLRKTP